MCFLPRLTVSFMTAGLAIAALALAQFDSIPDNATFFTGDPPSLVSANTPDTAIAWPYPHYFFTFNLPASSPESLGKVTIAPEASVQAIAFDLSATQAFEGTENNKGKALTLASVTQDAKTQIINIIFIPPVSPGTTFTISLRAVQNPSQSGDYLFRVQAFPAGDNRIRLDLGVGTFSFYQPF